MILHVEPVEPVAPAAVAPPRRLVRRQQAVLLLFLALLAAELFRPIATWPERWIGFAFWLYRLGWVAVLVLAFAFWLELHRYARAAGGASYATGYVLLSVCLTPVLGIGILWVPAMVRMDVARGQAAWRREREHDLRERALRTGLYLAALLALGLPLAAVDSWLALAAPVPAFFLQRLVLPWLRPASRAEDER